MNTEKNQNEDRVTGEDVAEAYQDEAEWAQRIQASKQPDVIIQKHPKQNQEK